MQSQPASTAPAMAPNPSGSTLAVQPQGGAPPAASASAGGMDIAAMLHQLTGSAAAAAAQAVQLQEQLMAQQQQQQAQVLELLRRRREAKHPSQHVIGSSIQPPSLHQQHHHHQHHVKSQADPAQQADAHRAARHAADIDDTDFAMSTGSAQLLEVASDTDLVQLAMRNHGPQAARHQQAQPPQQPQAPQQLQEQHQPQQQPQPCQLNSPHSSQLMELDLPNPQLFGSQSMKDRHTHHHHHHQLQQQYSGGLQVAQSPRMSTGTIDSSLLSQLQPVSVSRLDRLSTGSGPAVLRRTTSNVSAGSAEGDPGTSAPTASGGTSMSVDVLHYPPAEVPHSLVLANREVFNATLKRLHDKLGSKLRVPVVGGQDLDLWMLYRQVVACEGLAAVVAHKKWTDVCAPFNFPATFTSRSFTMRKLYSQLLWHYEQVYMHSRTGPLLPAPAPETGPLTMTAMAVEAKQSPRVKRRTLSVSHGALPPLFDVPMLPMQPPLPPAGVGLQPPGLMLPPTGLPPMATPPFTAVRTDSSGIRGLENVPVGTEVRGIITHKFPMGFSVRLDVQGATFAGMLYCPPEQASSQAATPSFTSSHSSPGIMPDARGVMGPPPGLIHPLPPHVVAPPPFNRSMSDGVTALGARGFGSFIDDDDEGMQLPRPGHTPRQQGPP